MYDYYKKTFFTSCGSSSYCKTAASTFMPGSLAGITAMVATYPFEVARTRLAVQTTGKLYNGVFHSFSTLTKTDGLSGLFKGIFPGLIGISVYSGVGFCIYFTSKEVFGHSGISDFFAFGAIAGLIGQFCSYPFDLVRKRMMTHGFIEQVSVFKSVHEGSSLQNARSFFFYVLRNERFKGLFKGFSLNIIRAPIASGIVHTTNELVNYHMGRFFSP